MCSGVGQCHLVSMYTTKVLLYVVIGCACVVVLICRTLRRVTAVILSNLASNISIDVTTKFHTTSDILLNFWKVSLVFNFIAQNVILRRN